MLEGEEVSLPPAKPIVVFLESFAAREPKTVGLSPVKC